MSKLQVILSREEVTQAIAQFVVAKYVPPGVVVECDVFVFGEHPKVSSRPHDTMKSLLAERRGGKPVEKTPEQQLLTEYGAIVMTG